jgi:hypothetical protein
MKPQDVIKECHPKHFDVITCQNEVKKINDYNEMRTREDYQKRRASFFKERESIYNCVLLPIVNSKIIERER